MKIKSRAAKAKPKSPYWKDKLHQYRPWLAGIATGLRARKIVEVGVYQGKLTAYLARSTRATVYAVDHWRGPAAYPGSGLRCDETTEAAFRRRVAPWLKEGRVVVVKEESVAAAGKLLDAFGPVFDLVFIDAAHDYESVRADILAWRPLVRPGGILCGHDYNWDGVRRAVGELVPAHKTGGGVCWWTEI